MGNADGEARVGPLRRRQARPGVVSVGIVSLLAAGCGRAPPDQSAPTVPVAGPRPIRPGADGPRPARPTPAARPPLPGSFEALREEALALAAGLRSRHPDAPEPIDLEAMMHDRFGNLAAATGLWEAWLADHPGSAEAHLRLGRYARERGEETVAVEHLERAFDARPDLPGAQVLLGESLTAVGRADDAIAVLARELPGTSGNPNRLTLLGHARLQRGDFAAAKADFQRALAIDPASTHALYGLSVACGRLGEKEAAERHRAEFAERKARSLSRDRANAPARLDDMPALAQAMAGWFVIAGRIERAGGDPAAAERAWLRALDFAPGQPEARSGLLESYRREGRDAEARALGRGPGAATQAAGAAGRN